MESTESYLSRKRREIALLESCLASPAEAAALASHTSSTSPAALVERKFRLAAAIRAERALRSWGHTETARFPGQRPSAGGFEFRYGYQRADLRVEGPPIYPALTAAGPGLVLQTTYAASGMSALAALLTGLLKLREPIEALVPDGCYSETRELMDSFGRRLCMFPQDATLPGWSTGGPMRVALLDSGAPAGLKGFQDMSPHDADLVIFDTTCLWRGSAQIRQVVDWALRAKLPLALVRSHAKLDCLGLEYGRLGSVVTAAPLQGVMSGRLKWTAQLHANLVEAVRLLGVAPLPANFPPFMQHADFERCSRTRLAAIIRNNRRTAAQLRAELPGSNTVSLFRHGLYLTLAPGRELPARDLRRAAAELCAELGAKGLPVSHAGSFGFDFVAIDAFTDPISRRDVLRVAPSDLPAELADDIALRIARWWSRQGYARSGAKAASPVRRPAEPGTSNPRHGLPPAVN